MEDYFHHLSCDSMIPHSGRFTTAVATFWIIAVYVSMLSAWEVLQGGKKEYNFVFTLSSQVLTTASYVSLNTL